MVCVVMPHPCGRVRARRREYLQCDEDSGNEKYDRPEHPHKSPCCHLIVQWGKAQRICLRGVTRIDRSPCKAKEGREPRIHNIRCQQIWKQHPTEFRPRAGPAPENGPPEQGTGEKEARMFDVMPALGPDRQLIWPWNVPSNIGDVHREPRYLQTGHGASQLPEPTNAQDRHEYAMNQDSW